MSKPIESSPKQKNKEQPDKPDSPQPDNARGHIINELMNDAASRPAAGGKPEEISIETSPDGKVTTTNKAAGSYKTFDPAKDAVIKVRDAKGTITVSKGSGIEITEPDGTVKTYAYGNIDTNGSVNFSTEDGTQHTRHISGAGLEISKDGQIKITHADGTIEERSIEHEIPTNLSNLPYGQDREIKSIVGRMSLQEANRALGEIEGDLDALTNFTRKLFPLDIGTDNPDNPFVNLNDLYNPDLSKIDLTKPLNDGQKFDLLKIRQERQRLRDQPMRELGDLDKFLKQEEDFRRDPFNLKRLMPEVSAKERKLQIKQDTLALALTGSTPDQLRQYEQRLAIERADRENPEASGPLSARLKVPIEQLTPQQKATYDRAREVQDVLRAQEIVSAHIRQLEQLRDEQILLERAQQPGGRSMLDILPNLSLSDGNKTDAQKVLANLTGRGTLGAEETKTYHNGLTVEPQPEGAYRVTLKDSAGNSDVYDINKDGKTVSARARYQYFKSPADTFYKIGPDGKEEVKIQTIKMDSDEPSGKPGREAKMRSVYVLNENREPVRTLKYEPNPGEETEQVSKAINDMNTEYNGDIGPDGKSLPKQTGTAAMTQGRDLILDLKKSESAPATKIVIKPDGTVSQLIEYDADEMGSSDGPEDEPPVAGVIITKSADGKAEDSTHLKANAEIISATLTRTGPKANKPITVRDGSVLTIGNQSLTIGRKSDAPDSRKPWEMDKPKEGKVWTVDYSSGEVSLQRDGGPVLRLSADAKTKSSPDKADNTIYQDDDDFSVVTQYINEDHSRKITAMELPEHSGATTTILISYDLNKKALDNVTVTYKPKTKKEK